MATSKTPQNDSPPDGAAKSTVVDFPAPEAPADPWADLAEPLLMAEPASVVAARINVLEDVPEQIRRRIEYSLMKTCARMAALATSTAKRPRIDPYWQIQPVRDDKQGAEFVAAATRYAKYRPAEGDIPHADPESPKGQITVRCGNVLHYVKTEAGVAVAKTPEDDGAFLGVRYSARPHEGRKDTARTPGTAR